MSEEMSDLEGAQESQLLAEMEQPAELDLSTDDEYTAPTEPVEGPPTTPQDQTPPTSIIAEIFRHLMNHLDFQDILRCRLVSRNVSEAVDKQLQSNLEIPIKSSTKHPQPSQFVQCRTHSSPTGPLIHEGIRLLDTENLREFLSKMGNNQRNPFIGRSVKFGNYGDTTKNSDYWDKALELLRRFGHHIYHVELSDGHVSISEPLVCYKLIRQCALLLPNLRTLELSFSHDEVDEVKVEALVNYVNDNPMPKLEYLDKLEWNDCQVSPVILDSIVACYSKNLKALAAPTSVFYVEINKFSNLAALYLTNVRDNEILIELRWCKLPSLKSLYMNMGGERTTSCGNITCEVWSIKSVLQLAKQFQLELLSLFIAPGGQLRGSGSLNVSQWRIQSLKTLEMQFCPGMSFEFLKCFSNLEHVHFYDIHHPLFPERHVTGEKSVVDVTGGSRSQVQSCVNVEEIQTVVVQDVLEVDQFLYARKMYESNVWRVIPSLKLVTFKCVWDREGKTLIDVNDWYWREIFEERNKGGYVAQVVSRVVGFVRSIFFFS